MNKLFILILVISFYILHYYFTYENFDGITDLGNIEKNPVYVHLYTDKGDKLNVTLISKPFGSDNAYKQYLINKPNKIYLGISSYMEFPYIPSNPNDKYVDIKNAITMNSNYNTFYHDM